MQRNNTLFADDSARRDVLPQAAHPPPSGNGKPRGRRNETVEVGSIIEIRDLRMDEDELEEYTLVPHDHADILENRISTFTPIGRALFGRRVGDEVEVAGPTGPVRLRIENIRNGRNGHRT